MSTINIAATFTPSNTAAGNIISNNTAFATLNAGPRITIAETQRGACAASLAGNITSRAKGTQQFAMMQTALAAQHDAVEVVAFLLTFVAASRCDQKYRTVKVIDQVAEIATLLLDEAYGLRAMALHRPDGDQLSELIRAINVARSAAGLSVLSSLH